MKYIKLLHYPTEVVLESCLEDKQGININVRKELQGDKHVTLIGDWDKRMLEFVDVLEIISKYKLTPRFVLNGTMDEFRLKIGMTAYSKIKGIEIDENELPEYDRPMMIFMGAMLMNTYLQHTDYYLETIEDGGKVVNTIKLPKGE